MLNCALSPALSCVGREGAGKAGERTKMPRRGLVLPQEISPCLLVPYNGQELLAITHQVKEMS